MNKKEIVKIIHLQTRRDTDDINIIINSFLETVKEALQKNEKITIQGFGSFFCKYKKEKKGRDIQKNRTIIIPSRFVPVFKASKIFEDKIKNNNLNTNE